MVLPRLTLGTRCYHAAANPGLTRHNQAQQRRYSSSTFSLDSPSVVVLGSSWWWSARSPVRAQPTDHAPESELPLESWKEIAAYLKRDINTLKRWARSEGLPVHRHLHVTRSSVWSRPTP